MENNTEKLASKFKVFKNFTRVSRFSWQRGHRNLTFLQPFCVLFRTSLDVEFGIVSSITIYLEVLDPRDNFFLETSVQKVFSICSIVYVYSG